MNLYVAVTMYEDKVFGKCVESVMRNIAYLQKKGHTVTPLFLSELYIDRARNICVDNFLKTDCSDILFVDADLAFDDDSMYKIIQHDKPIVAGSYRLKQVAELYPTVIDWKKDNNNCLEEETGLIWVESAPTGFMRIQRHVFDDMKKKYEMTPDTKGVLHFFETGMKVFNDGQWWGEDTSFCKKWRDMGGDVMVEPRITFTHIGNQEFTGNMHEHLMSRKVEDIDKVPSGIKGWMTDSELLLLRKLASQSNSVIEIGCWKGRSTKEFLENCKGTVYAVDHFNGATHDATNLATFGLDIYSEFIKNVGHYKNLKIMQGDSLEMVKNFNGTKVDLVFIDAGHTYEECKADIDAWMPKCNKIIAGHDYTNEYDGVKEAVHATFPDEKINILDSIWWVEL